MPDSILIISFKLLGDIIVQTPAIKSIKQTFPNSRLTVLVDKKFQDILAGNKYVDEIITYNVGKYKKSNFFMKTYLIIRFLRGLKKYKFNKILLMDRTSLGCIISFFSGAVLRIGLKNQTLSFLLNKKVEIKEGSMDYIDFYNALAKASGGENQERKTELVVDSYSLEKSKKILSDFFQNKTKFISIHLGASREDKRWSSEQFALFITQMLRHTPGAFSQTKISPLGIIVMCGPQENELLEDLFFHLDPALKSQILRVGELHMKELISFFHLSDLILCHDSASRHVAAALSKNTVVLMNDWNLKNWKLYTEEDGQFVVTPRDETKNLYDVKSIPCDLVVNKVLQILSNSSLASLKTTP